MSLDFLTRSIGLRAQVRRKVLEDGAVVLWDAARVVVFDEDLERVVLQGIDGARTGMELGQLAAAQGHRQVEVVEALLNWHSGGWIDWQRQPLRIVVHEFASQGSAVARAVEAADGLAFTHSADDADLEVVVAHDYLDPEVDAATAAAAGPVLLVRVDGHTAWIGPVVGIEGEACWECLAHRLRRSHEGHSLLAGDGAAPVTRGLPEVVGAAVAGQLESYARSQRDHPLASTLRSLDAEGLGWRVHSVTRRPQCPRCGEAPGEPRPVELGARDRVGEGESGFRALDPETLLRDYDYHVSPITGIVNGIWRVGDDDAVHVARAPHMPNRPADSWRAFRVRGRNAAGGKGTTEIQARASALGESLERYSSVWDGTEHARRASYSELADAGEPVLHPRECMLFSDAQYDGRQAINDAALSGKQRVPEPYPDDAPILWCKVWSLSHERWTWVPAAYAYFAAPQDPQYLIGESNGNAAGASLEDAVLQGFLELVERDAVALWWYNALRRPGVDLGGIDDDYIEPLRASWERSGREFWVLDVTTDLEVPAFVAVGRATGDGPDEISFGFGAHVDARVGVLRAIAEMNQLMPAALREVDRPDRMPEEWAAEGTSFRLTVEEAPYLAPDPDARSRTLDDFEAEVRTDIAAVVSDCRARVERAGMEMLVHDLTRPDVGLPVAKVIVPGMRHFWPRFGPGRLYDVPVAMGWLDAANTEATINRVLING